MSETARSHNIKVIYASNYSTNGKQVKELTNFIKKNNDEMEIRRQEKDKLIQTLD